MASTRNRSLPSPIEPPAPRRRWLRWCVGIALLLGVWQLTASFAPIPGPLLVAGRVSDRIYDLIYGGTIAERAGALPDDVNVLLIGLDNRLGAADNHADALHLLRIHTRRPVSLEIVAIPRSTPVRGYGIPAGRSYMANLRKVHGRDVLISAVAKHTGEAAIPYYVELTFSQVMGILELLGYRDPATTLQFLRHRKSFRHGDIQRSYNQADFIRRQLIRRSDLLEGAKGDLLIRMGLSMVESNLDLETVQALLYVMRRADALDNEHITLSLRSDIDPSELDPIDAPEPDDVGAVVSRLARKAGERADTVGRFDPYPTLRTILDRAEARPAAVIKLIEPIYAQKGWLQIQERARRREIRDHVESLLIASYTAAGRTEAASAVQSYMNDERRAFGDVEREERRFTYTKRVPATKPAPVDSVPAVLSRRDDSAQKKKTVVKIEKRGTRDSTPTRTERKDGEMRVVNIEPTAP